MTAERKDILMEQLRDIECQLSPENLSHDGERSPSQVNAARANLGLRKRKIIKELGYEPTLVDLYPELHPMQARPERERHIETLDGLIDENPDDELGQALTPIRDFLKRIR